jgi:DNA-binding PadR family transcriptional regulator
VTKTYAITPQGLREYQRILQILDLTDSLLTPQNEVISVITDGESTADIPISAQVAEDISDILRDVFLDDSPSEIELQRIQAGTKKMIKYLQRTFH